jgi:hypothetical protein
MSPLDRESLPPSWEHLSSDSETSKSSSPYPPYPSSKEKDHRDSGRKEEKTDVRIGGSGSDTGSPSKTRRSLSSNADRARSGASHAGPHACGSATCRVCVALGFIAKPNPKLVARLPGKTHPLNTRSALARAERVYEALRAYQVEHGHPPQSLALIVAESGFARSGLLSRYMQRLEIDGRVRRMPARKRGRFQFRWEAVIA